MRATLSNYNVSPKILLLTNNIFFYIVIGAIAAIVDFGAFGLINIVTSYKFPELANALGATLGFLCSFSLNTFFNFKKSDKLIKRFLSYLTICFVGMIISTFTIYLLKNYINLMLLKIICMGLVSAIQFTLNKLITYK
jgi:Predicted membrane protein